MFNAFVGYENIMPLIAPVDMASTVKTSPYVDLKYAQDVAFLVSFGAITSTTTTDTIVITVEAASAPTGAESAIGFNYRKSGEAASANTWAAKAAATSTGLAIGVTEDGILVWIELDPAAVQADIANARYVRLVLTDTPDMEAALVGAVALMRPRYKMTTFLSATAAASA